MYNATDTHNHAHERTIIWYKEQIKILVTAFKNYIEKTITIQGIRIGIVGDYFSCLFCLSFTFSDTQSTIKIIFTHS